MSEHSPTSAVRPRIRLARGMSWERIMLLLIVFYLGGRELLPAIRTFAQAQTQAGAPNANGLPATAFTYQGRVELDGVPLSGTYDLTFKLWDAAALGVLQGTSGPSATQITNGLFAATLDFNQAYTEGKRRWWRRLSTRRVPRQPFPSDASN